MKVKENGNMVLDTVEIDGEYYIKMDDLRTFFEFMRIKGYTLDDAIETFDACKITDNPRKRWGLFG